MIKLANHRNGANYCIRYWRSIGLPDIREFKASARANISYLLKELFMIEFTVPDISCGHCAGVVQKTVKGLDQTATVEVDVPGKRVKITSGMDRAAFADALVAAGYPPSGPW